MEDKPVYEVKDKGGRPPTGPYTEKGFVRLTKAQRAHLEKQYSTISEGLRKLVEKSMMRESIPTHELTPLQRKYLIDTYGSVPAGITALIEKDKGETF